MQILSAYHRRIYNIVAPLDYLFFVRDLVAWTEDCSRWSDVHVQARGVVDRGLLTLGVEQPECLDDGKGEDVGLCPTQDLADAAPLANAEVHHVLVSLELALVGEESLRPEHLGLREDPLVHVHSAREVVELKSKQTVGSLAALKEDV